MEAWCEVTRPNLLADREGLTWAHESVGWNSGRDEKFNKKFAHLSNKFHWKYGLIAMLSGDTSTEVSIRIPIKTLSIKQRLMVRKRITRLYSSEACTNKTASTLSSYVLFVQGFHVLRTKNNNVSSSLKSVFSVKKNVKRTALYFCPMGKCWSLRSLRHHRVSTAGLGRTSRWSAGRCGNRVPNVGWSGWLHVQKDHAANSELGTSKEPSMGRWRGCDWNNGNRELKHVRSLDLNENGSMMWGHPTELAGW